MLFYVQNTRIVVVFCYIGQFFVHMSLALTIFWEEGKAQKHIAAGPTGGYMQRFGRAWQQLEKVAQDKGLWRMAYEDEEETEAVNLWSHIP